MTFQNCVDKENILNAHRVKRIKIFRILKKTICLRKSNFKPVSLTTQLSSICENNKSNKTRYNRQRKILSLVLHTIPRFKHYNSVTNSPNDHGQCSRQDMGGSFGGKEQQSLCLIQKKDIDNHYLYIDQKFLSVTYLKIVTRKLKIGMHHLNHQKKK